MDVRPANARNSLKKPACIKKYCSKGATYNPNYQNWPNNFFLNFAKRDVDSFSVLWKTFFFFFILGYQLRPLTVHFATCWITTGFLVLS